MWWWRLLYFGLPAILITYLGVAITISRGWVIGLSYAMLFTVTFLFGGYSFSMYDRQLRKQEEREREEREWQRKMDAPPPP